MKKVLYTGTIALVLAFVLMYVPIGYAQNLTSNATNMLGNASAGLNQTASELGKNDTFGNVLNKTGEVGKKILGGAADVVSNISEEVKEGIGANK
jgi:predicted PurR-regulated permease PerM